MAGIGTAEQQEQQSNTCSGWYQQQQAKTSSLPFTPPSSDKGAQIPSHHGGKTQQKTPNNFKKKDMESV